MIESINEKLIGGTANIQSSSSVSGRSGDDEGGCSGGTLLTPKGAPTGLGFEPKQVSSEGVVAKEGNTGSNVSAELNRKQQNRRMREKERHVKQLMKFEQMFERPQKFTKYYVITFPGIRMTSELNVITDDKEIKEKIGGCPTKISKRNNSALLIEVVNEAQGRQVVQIDKIVNNPVTVQPHRTLNSVKGTVYSEVMSQSSIEELEEVLKGQGAVKIRE